MMVKTVFKRRGLVDAKLNKVSQCGWKALGLVFWCFSFSLLWGIWKYLIASFLVAILLELSRRCHRVNVCTYVVNFIGSMHDLR